MVEKLDHIKKIMRELPQVTGVYFMYAHPDDAIPLYIGKSNSIRHRICSHYQEAKKK